MDNLAKIKTMSPLTWAYIGDAVYELYIREHLIEITNLKPNKLHKEAIKYVKSRSTSRNTRKTTKIFNRRGEGNSKKRKKHTKSSFAKECKANRLYVFNSLRSVNRIFVFNSKL